MKLTKMKRGLLWGVAYLALANCGGGGCSSCGGGITPIPGGFPLTPDRRIPHAMQIRLTDQGLRSVEAIGPALFSNFLGSGVNVPRTSQSVAIGQAVICPGDNCRINVRLANTAMDSVSGLQLAFQGSDQIRATVRVVLSGDIPLQVCAGIGCSSTCGGALCGTIARPTLRIDTTQGGHRTVGLITAIQMGRDTHPARLNYTRPDLVSATGTGEAVQLSPTDNVEDADFQFTDSWISGILNLFRGIISGQLTGQLSAALGPIQSALAATATPNPPGCPTGTTVSGANCHYSDNSLVPMLLGTDGQGDLGALLRSVTPGASARNAYVIAVGDPAHGGVVQGAGMNLNMFGAVVSQGHNACVPRVTAPAMPNIPEFMSLRSNTIPGTTTNVDLGIGVAEDFLNSSLWNMWDSGMFCLGVNSRLSQFLSTGTLATFSPLAGLRAVTFPSAANAVAIVMRPQNAPTITIGTTSGAPLMNLTFRQMAIDFYAWSEERYIRAFTFTSDLSVPISLTQETGGLRPVLGMVNTANPTVTNSQLLGGDPGNIADAVNAVIGTAVMTAAGSLPTIAIPSVPLPGTPSPGSVVVNLPMMGVQGVADSGSRYLGLFANLQYRAGARPDTISIDTTAEARVNTFDPQVYETLEAYRRDGLPTIHVRAGAVNDFGHDLEYSYRVDELQWSAWAPGNEFDASSPTLAFQGRHVVEVRARAAGQVDSLDTDPVRLEVMIDTQGPELTVNRADGALVASATDLVGGNVEYSVQFDNGAATSWGAQARFTLPEGARSWVVSARDERGNVTTQRGDLNQSPVSQEPHIIRGGPSTDASSGCGCSTPGNGSSKSTTGLLALLGTMGALWALRRRTQRRATALVPVRVPAKKGRNLPSSRALVFWGVCVSFFTALGCNCGDNGNGNMDGGGPRPEAGGPEASVSCTGGAMRCARTNMCVNPSGTCSCPRGQAAMGMPTFDSATCMWSTDNGASACNCQPLPGLGPGLVGSHLDIAVHTDNTLWMSAYSPGVPTTFPYGDLVVGQWDRTANRVTWTHVDGVPADGMVTGDVNGWRGGISTPGPDVGRWNSLALNAMGQPRVSYWDTTNDQLRFASYDGTAWRTHAVDTHDHNGRYTSLALLSDGRPAIAYRATRLDTMTGRVNAEVRVAIASNPNPAAATDWTTTVVATAQSSCRASDCPTGQACVKSTGLCQATGTCMSSCAMGQACVANACVDTYTASWVEDFPPGMGLFNSLAVDSMNRLALVFYNRDRGNLMGVAQTNATTWGMPFVIDGEGSMMADQGDRGAWASLAIDSMGIWNVAYVDGWAERILFARVQNGARMGMPEVVDDGSALGTTTFDDGQHIVGDSTQLSFSASGAPQLVYQDSTAGTLRFATRNAMGMWTLSAVDSTFDSGFWARIERTTIATYFRNPAAPTGMPRSGVRVFPTP